MSKDKRSSLPGAQVTHTSYTHVGGVHCCAILVVMNGLGVLVGRVVVVVVAVTWNGVLAM